MNELQRLIRAVEKEFGQCRNWIPLIANAKLEIEHVQRIVRGGGVRP